jgi:putative SOS response-associated peptidase YedK
MCGRYIADLPAAEIAQIFQTRNPIPNYPARYNVAPTQPVLTVRFNPKTRERALDPLRWGLVPHWAPVLAAGSSLINARAESIAEKPSFRHAFARRRCLIPATGFYEWQKIGTGKRPFAVVPKDQPLFAFAGLWENWRDPSRENSEWVRSCTIVTTTANELLTPLHPRMPVILDKEAWSLWLGEEPGAPETLLALLKPYPADRIRVYPVGTQVNNVKNDDASLLQAVQ